jgi:hypothetical protein
MKRKTKDKDFIVDVHRTIESDVEVKVKAPTNRNAKKKAREELKRDNFEPLNDDEVKDKIKSVTKI